MIDFGCTRELTDEEWEMAYAIEEATLVGDEAKIDYLTARACLANDPAEMEPEKFRAVRRGVGWQMEPWLKQGRFDFGDRDFFLRGIDSILEMIRKRCSCGYPVYLWTNRFIIGGRAVCYRLRGRADFRRIKEQESRTISDPTA